MAMRLVTLIKLFLILQKEREREREREREKQLHSTTAQRAVRKDLYFSRSRV